MKTAVAQQQAFATVPKLWPCETVVCIGGGTSLTPDDVNYVRGKARVIAIKEAMLLAPWADVLYAADSKWWRFYKGAPEFQGLKYGIEQLETPPIDWPDVQVLRNTGTNGLELDPTGLRIGNNSGYQAINLAVHFGAAKIILLGFDCWAGPNGQQNWFGDHPNHVRSPYPLFLQQFATIAEPLKAAGVEVINCSRFTMLRCFPQMDLAEALP
jgi:hypothetical protein